MSSACLRRFPPSWTRCSSALGLKRSTGAAGDREPGSGSRAAAGRAFAWSWTIALWWSTGEGTESSAFACPTVLNSDNWPQQPYNRYRAGFVQTNGACCRMLAACGRLAVCAVDALPSAWADNARRRRQRRPRPVQGATPYRKRCVAGAGDCAGWRHLNGQGYAASSASTNTGTFTGSTPAIPASRRTLPGRCPRGLAPAPCSSLSHSGCRLGRSWTSATKTRSASRVTIGRPQRWKTGRLHLDAQID